MLAIAVMICTGCRPKELQNGINMKLDKTTGNIHFVITSAKRKHEKTQVRQFAVRNNEHCSQVLNAPIEFNQGQLQLRDVNYKAVSTEVGRLRGCELIDFSHCNLLKNNILKMEFRD